MANVKFSQIANGGNINLTNDQVLIVRGGNTDNLASIPGMINAVYDGANSISSGTLQFSNSNGVSFGINGSTLTGSVAVQTAQTIGVYAISNTTGASSSSTMDARSLSFDALGAISVGISNGSIQLSVAAGAQSNQTIGGYAVGNTTLSTSNTMDARSLSFVGDGIASVGMSNGSVQISVPSPPAQTNQSIGIYAVSNTTLSTFGTVDARTLSFEGAGAVSVGVSNGSVQISAPNTIAQTVQTLGFYGFGNTTQNSSTTLDARTLSFDGLGGISVGFSNGTIQLSGPQTAAQTAQTVGLYGVGNTTQNSSTTLDARTLSFNGLGIITAGFSNGSIQLSATTAAQTAQSMGFYAVGNTTQSSSTTLDARTISINGLGIITAGFSNGSIDISATQSNQNASAANGSFNFQTISFSNVNGVSFGTSAGSAITASIAAQSADTAGIYASSNTTGASSSSTYDVRSLTIQGLGGLSVGWSNGTLQLSGANPVAGIALYDGANSITSGTAIFTNANGVSFTFNGQTISGSVAAQTNQSIGFYAVGNTTQSSSTTLDARTLSFDGLGAQTVGFSNGSIQLSVPATSSLVGVGGISISTNGSTISVSYLGNSQVNDYSPWPLKNTTLTSFGQNTLNLGAFYPPQGISMNNVAIFISLGNTISVTSHAMSETISYALYSKGTGANSTAISQMASSSILLVASYSGILSGGYTVSAGTNSTTYSSAGTGMTSNWTGQKIFSLPFATSLSAPGEYWFGIANSTASVADTLALALSYVAVSGMSNASWGVLATNTVGITNKSIIPNEFGAILSVTSNAWPAKIAYTDMSNQVSNLVPYIFLAT